MTDTTLKDWAKLAAKDASRSLIDIMVEAKVLTKNQSIRLLRDVGSEAGEGGPGARPGMFAGERGGGGRAAGGAPGRGGATMGSSDAISAECAARS